MIGRVAEELTVVITNAAMAANVSINWLRVFEGG
jgi:hypothetical protein